MPLETTLTRCRTRLIFRYLHRFSSDLISYTYNVDSTCESSIYRDLGNRAPLKYDILSEFVAVKSISVLAVRWL